MKSTMIDHGADNPKPDTGGSEKRPRCRTCNAELAPDHPGPFCSQRCRMADLGKWFSGDYSISRNIEERDLDEES